MRTEYTHKEREIINDGWSSLMHFADQRRMADRPELESILKEERREVSSPTVAKALLLRTLVNTCCPDSEIGKSLAELWGMQSTHRHIVAFACAYHDGLTSEGVTYQARQAANAQQAATKRALDALDNA